MRHDSCELGCEVASLGNLLGRSYCFTVLATLTDENHHMNLAEPHN
jgi:phosphoglycerate dehydrogenase-like enzyme